MRTDSERLRDIIESAEKISRYSRKGKNTFDEDELIRTWMVHHILLIGEAASRITENFREKHDEIPWAGIIGMRNIIVHEYFGIDYDEVWRTATNDLPSLINEIRKILEQS